MTTKKSKIEIELKPLENIVVQVPNQARFNLLMRIFELGGWKWNSKSLATSKLIYWRDYLSKTCVEAKPNFNRSSDTFYENEMKYKIISDNEFYRLQNLTQDYLNKVYEDFMGKK